MRPKPPTYVCIRACRICGLQQMHRFARVVPGTANDQHGLLGRQRCCRSARIRTDRLDREVARGVQGCYGKFMRRPYIDNERVTFCKATGFENPHVLAAYIKLRWGG